MSACICAEGPSTPTPAPAELVRASAVAPPVITRTPVLAATAWRTNGEMIADVHRLGYVRDTDRILDATYGCGAFWRTWRPRNLVGRDRINDPAWDYEAMDYPDASFDVTVFDPPYKLNGTPAMGAMDDRYGTVSGGTSWQDKHAGIKRGIAESLRVVVSGGILLLKCQDQVCSGHVRWQTIEFSQHAMERGARLVDMFHFLNGPRPQPAGRHQVHARRNFSTLLILKKDAPRRINAPAIGRAFDPERTHDEPTQEVTPTL
ncbi:MAG TPA: hypothetical protein VNC61_07565 [Acidimicrobiales bacterium]|nr:hypothetical protein [Acidimicrobiales bacterium]